MMIETSLPTFSTYDDFEHPLDFIDNQNTILDSEYGKNPNSSVTLFRLSKRNILLVLILIVILAYA
jgi:hypothetical protein